jgi:ABC-type transport system involved in Fe-S cluster assembly fused permease/ATPase subunit
LIFLDCNLNNSLDNDDVRNPPRLRFYDPQEGTILLDGRELTSLRLKDIRKEIGLVAQNTELFAGSVEENISYGMEPGSYTRYHIAPPLNTYHSLMMLILILMLLCYIGRIL